MTTKHGECQTLMKNFTQTCSFDECAKPLAASLNSCSMEKEVWRASQDTKFIEGGIDCNDVALPRPKERNGCFLLGDYRRDISQIPSSRLTVAMAVLSSWYLDFPQDKIMGKCPGVHTPKEGYR